MALLGGPGELGQERHVGQVLVALDAGLRQERDLVFREPIGMLALDRVETEGARLHLAALHAEIDVLGGLVADHQLESGAEHVVHGGRNDGDARAGTGRAQHDLLLHGLLDGADAGGVPDQNHLVLRAGRAQPVELGGVEAHAASVQHLMQRHGVVDAGDGQAVLGRDVVHVVGGQHVAAARHVLHDQGRVAGDVAPHVARDHPRGEVVDPAHPGAGDDGDGLALVELGRRFRRGRPHDPDRPAGQAPARHREVKASSASGVAREVVAFLDDDLEQERRAGLRDVDRLLDRADDVGRLLDPRRRDVEALGHLGVVAAHRHGAVFLGPRS